MILLTNVDFYKYEYNKDERVVVSKGANGLIHVVYDQSSIDNDTTTQIKVMAIKEGSDTFIIQKFDSELKLIETKRINLIAKSSYDKTIGLKFSVAPYLYNKYYFMPTSFPGVFPIISGYIYYDPIEELEVYPDLKDNEENGYLYYYQNLEIHQIGYKRQDMMVEEYGNVTYITNITLRMVNITMFQF